MNKTILNNDRVYEVVIPRKEKNDTLILGYKGTYTSILVHHTTRKEKERVKSMKISREDFKAILIATIDFMKESE